MRSRSEISQLVSSAGSRKDLKQLTVKELRIAVREAVKDVNIRYQYMESEQAKIAYDKLKIYGVSKPSESGVAEAEARASKKVVAGNVNWKSKDELLDQLQALKRFQKFDYESPQAQKRYEEEWKDAAQRFRKAYPKYQFMSTEDLKAILKTLDKYSDFIDANAWKYELIEASVLARRQKNPLDMNKVLDVIKSSEGKGLSKGAILDQIYKDSGIKRK